MDVIYEWVWDALSYSINPVMLYKILYFANEESRERFRRVESSTMVNMFNLLLKHVKHVNPSHRKSFFEQFLTEKGYIPKLSTKRGLASNDSFGFVDEHTKQWIDWSCSSVEVMRFYWDEILCRTTSTHRNHINDICRQIVCMLPGKLTQCTHCQWTLPETAMFSQTQCNYCDSRTKQASLCTYRGVSFLVYPQPNRQLNNLIQDLAMCSLSGETDKNIEFISHILEKARLND